MLRCLRLALLLVACAPAAARAQGLPPEVEAALARARVPRDALAVLVVPAEGGPPRLAHRADVPVNPASLAKLVTTYAALDLLGPAYAWTTSVHFGGPVQDGVLRGHLYIRGGGDPGLVHERLWRLLRRVQGLGVRQVAGDIVLDRSAFAVPPQDPGAFDGEPLRPYNAAPDALLVNFKSVLLTFTPEGGAVRVHAEPPLAGVAWPATVPASSGECGDWRAALRANFQDLARIRFEGSYPAACGERTWPLAFPDPEGYAGRVIAGLWQEMGGQLAGRVRDGRVPPGLAPVIAWKSPPLAEVVRDINKFSNNVMAQQVFLTLGMERQGTGSFEAAREALRAWWTERFGGEPPEIANGAGLSRTDRVTARQLAQLLQAGWSSALMPDLAASMPIAGIDGTLRRGRRVAGLAHLKTGSLRDVAGIAGYVHGAGGRRWVLVAIVHHPGAAAARPALEALVEWTAGR